MGGQAEVDEGHITYLLTLDVLSEDRAIYVGGNNMAATIDRAAFNSQGRPTHVTLRVPKAADFDWHAPPLVTEGGETP